MMDEIRAAKAGDVLWDKGDKASVKGLHLRVLPDGRKVFYLYYRTKAQTQRRPKLGEFGELTLHEARKRASSLMARVAVGEDPKGQWDEKKAEMDVGALFAACWKGHWDTPRYQQSGWAYEVNRLYEKDIKPKFGKVKLSEMSVASIRSWHKGYEDKPLAGNRALNVLSKLFSFAEHQEWRPQHTNPCELVTPFTEKKRKRYATTDEIQRIAPLLERDKTARPAAVAFLYLLMFTGARPRFIARAKWEHLKEFVGEDGKLYGILTLAGKTSADSGEDEKVIVPPQAMTAIALLPRIEGGTITGIRMPTKYWGKIRAEAGAVGLWARDWRRTFATIGMSGGIDMSTISEALNHKSTQTTKLYAKLIPTEQVEVATKIANQMEKLLGKKAV